MFLHTHKLEQKRNKALKKPDVFNFISMQLTSPTTFQLRNSLRI